LYIWQDENTASAAEVFIAGLTQNKRALSLGTQSFGKGLAQRVVELTDGSALFITYGKLIPPSGRSFHEMGLKADYPLSAGSAVFDAAYRAMLRRVLRQADRRG
jgi:carboxyl-terminal processing protease